MPEKAIDGHVDSPTLPRSDLYAIPEDTNQELEPVKVIDKNECFLCHGVGHWARECTSLPKMYLGDNPPVCYSCGGEGHFARACPSVYKMRPAKYAQSMTSEPETESTRSFHFQRPLLSERRSERTVPATDALYSQYAMLDLSPYAYSYPYQAAPYQHYFAYMYDYGVPYPVVATSDYYSPRAMYPAAHSKGQSIVTEESTAASGFVDVSHATSLDQMAASDKDVDTQC